MARVSEITFNGSNAYELSNGEFVTSWPHGAVGFEQVSAGVQLYSATAGAGAKLRIRAINAAGGIISEQEQTHILSVLSMWERAEKTYTVPAGTDKVELRIIATGGTILLAQPKLANGAAVGAYATNFAPQLTMLTPTGIYTGTITAEQIILTGGERLPDRLLSLNASIISLKSGIDNAGAKIATIEADAITLTDTVTKKTSKLTADGLYTAQVTANQVQTGLLQSTNNSSWINLDNGRFSFGDGALAWDGSILQVNGRFLSHGAGRTSRLSDGQFMIENGGVEVFNITNLTDQEKAVYIVLGHGADYLHIGISDASGSINDNFMSFNRSGKTIDVHRPITINNTLKTSAIYSRGGNNRLSLIDDGELRYYDHLSRLRVATDVNASYLRAPNGNVVGTDNGGVYKIVSGVKTYL